MTTQAVALRAGAWIETREDYMPADLGCLSPSVRGRGLKPK